MLAGKIKDKLVFALPGNPAASLTWYYIYVQPVLKTISGEIVANKQKVEKELAHEFDVNNTRSQFLKAVFSDHSVSVLTHQNSSMLNTFVLASYLVFLSEGNYHLEKDAKVQIYHI